MLRFNLSLLLVISLLSAASSAQDKSYPPKMSGAKEIVYKNASGVDLRLYVFNPTNHQASDPKPAIVFFFGGGWTSGTPAQFQPHCLHLAKRGMVAICADYRVASRNKVSPKDCVEDAKSAIRWVREHAADLGIDPNRIAAGGGSAGGHLAACTGILPGIEPADEGKQTSSQANAMVLFNPALVLAPTGSETSETRQRMESLAKRFGDDPRKLSPYHHVAPNQPPTIIFHGQADTTVPFSTVEAFTAAMKSKGNRCELIAYPDQGHGFFNFGRQNNLYYEKTVAKMDEFLVSIDYLKPLP